MFLITAAFLYIHLEEVVDYYSLKQSEKAPVNDFKYIEVPSQGESYVYKGVIYTLNKNRFTGIDFEGQVLYERILETDHYSMKGIRDFIFLVSPENTIVLDDENHYVKEIKGDEQIDGIVPIVGDKFVIYSRKDGNYKASIYDYNFELVHDYVQKDATIDVGIEKNYIEVLNIKKTEKGLSTVLNKINERESKTILELAGYVPYKFYNTGKGYLIATDKEVVYYDGNNVEGKIPYEGFRGLFNLDKNYCLFADNILYILGPDMSIIKKEELSGFDRIKKLSHKVMVFTNREFLIVDDTGIIKRVKTERDIIDMYGEDRPIVKFRNGFIIY